MSGLAKATLTFVFMACQIITAYAPPNAFTQNDLRTSPVVEPQQETSASPLMQVILRPLIKLPDDAALQSVQGVIQDIEGIRYVGVNTRSGELIVQYWAGIKLDTLMNVLTQSGRQATLVAGPDTVEGESIKRIQSTLSEGSKIRLECLRHEDARELCQTHFNGLPNGIDLEKCYSIKVNFKTVAHVDSNFDWLSQTCLVDESGAQVKPLTWLNIPSALNYKQDMSTGLLIFPKVPHSGPGLTLRFLKANGDGYDSYTVDLPNLPVTDKEK